jgi:hypothetical protein
MVEVPGQLNGLRVGLWSNALEVSLDGGSEVFVNVPTLTLHLRMLMFNILFLLLIRIKEIELKF